MVPGTFTAKEKSKARDFIIDHISKCKYSGDKINGNPFLSYGDVARHMGYTIENEYDGDRIGTLVGQVSMDENKRGGPLLSAVVVNASNEKKQPGRGFYRLGIQLGMLKDRGKVNPDGLEELSFWNRHVLLSVKKYGRENGK